MLPDTIILSSDPAGDLSRFIAGKKYSAFGILVDENTQELCYPLIRNAFPDAAVICTRAGEQQKNIDTCVKVWRQMTELAFDRHALLIILGGGVLGDLGGFCAATYKRGIDFLLMPTTLLSQVDASIGGKLGIDFQSYKNHIGLFQQPLVTLIAPEFLKTLPERELRSGFAEVIKHCLISDNVMWDKVRGAPLAAQKWEELIPHSVAFKRGVVEEDPKESGPRKILNFGHSVGHAVEGHFLSAGDPLFHGEAVAIGMIAEAFIGLEKGLITAGDLNQISEYLIAIFSRIALPNDKNAILERMRQDKKNQGNRMLLVLPKGIGNAVWDVEVSEKEVVNSLDYYASL